MANAAQRNQPLLVRRDCIQAVISQPFHCFLQELFSLVSPGLMEIGAFRGTASRPLAPVDGKTFAVNHEDAVVFMRANRVTPLTAGVLGSKFFL